MEKKITVFTFVVVVLVLAIVVVSGLGYQTESGLKEAKIEPAVKRFIEVFNNAAIPEYKTMYWELLSQQSKDKLIQQAGSEEAAKSEVWIMLQEVTDAQRQVEYLGLDYVDIQGNIVTVVIRVRITEPGQEPVETTTLHRYRWEDGEWKFIDWFVEPEMYQG
jgi:hypothetical protein